jgi:DNA-nicking Smr family endonuclease
MMTQTPQDSGDEEDFLWGWITADVTPLPGRKKPPQSPAPAKAVKTRIVPPVPASPLPTPAKTGTPGRDVDRRTQQRLERGQIDIDATLDLHGYGQDRAREALRGFVMSAHAQGMRCVLVITGKGKDGKGVLRSRLSEWVDEAPLNLVVLRTAQARQRQGGGGAFYILLRRQRA